MLDTPRLSRLLFVVFVVLTALSACAAAPDPPEEPSFDVVHPVPAIGHQLGPDDALVTFVLCSDFECPACSTVAPTLGELAALYPEDLRLLYVPYPMPYHSRAIPAAVAAECAAAQGKFWPYHDQLFAHQDALDDRSLRSYAGHAGLVLADWLQCIDSAAPRAAIEQRREQMLQLGVIGTPSYFLNGRYERGAKSLAAFTELVEARLAEARSAIERGVPRADYYDREVVHPGQPAQP